MKNQDSKNIQQKIKDRRKEIQKKISEEFEGNNRLIGLLFGAFNGHENFPESATKIVAKMTEEEETKLAQLLSDFFCKKNQDIEEETKESEQKKIEEDHFIDSLILTNPRLFGIIAGLLESSHLAEAYNPIFRIVQRIVFENEIKTNDQNEAEKNALIVKTLLLIPKTLNKLPNDEFDYDIYVQNIEHFFDSLAKKLNLFEDDKFDKDKIAFLNNEEVIYSLAKVVFNFDSLIYGEIRQEGRGEESEEEVEEEVEEEDSLEELLVLVAGQVAVKVALPLKYIIGLVRGDLTLTLML